MSTLKINKVTNAGSATDAPNGFTVGGAGVEQTYTSSATEPSSPATGDLWWDSGNDTLYRYVNGEFKPLDAAAPVYFVWGGDRGVWAGGDSSGNVMDYVDMTTTGNATDFGDTTVTAEGRSATSNGTRAVWGGGFTSPSTINNMDYITTATTGNAQDFGDLATSSYFKAQGVAADGTYGLFAAGYSSTASGNINSIEYITVATTGNGTDFGDITVGATSKMFACCDATYSLFAGGSGRTDVIDYVTTATPGNATDFGDLTLGRDEGAGTSDASRGLFMSGLGGSNPSIIDYVTIATPGNATDFGDFSRAGYARYGSACCNGTNAVFGGANWNGTIENTLEYVVVQTTGNAQDFGDLTASRSKTTAATGAAA